MKPTREELEEQWKLLWARGVDLDERQERLLLALETIEKPLWERAAEQLNRERQQHDEELAELYTLMEEHGGFEE